MVAGLTVGCDMRYQRQLAVDDDAKVASRFGDSDTGAEHQDFLARDLVEQRTQAEPHQLCLCRVQLQSIHAQPRVNIHDTCSESIDCQWCVVDGCAKVDLAVVGVRV